MGELFGRYIFEIRGNFDGGFEEFVSLEAVFEEDVVKDAKGFFEGEEGNKDEVERDGFLDLQTCPVLCGGAEDCSCVAAESEAGWGWGVLEVCGDLGEGFAVDFAEGADEVDVDVEFFARDVVGYVSADAAWGVEGAGEKEFGVDFGVRAVEGGGYSSCFLEKALGVFVDGDFQGFEGVLLVLVIFLLHGMHLVS